MRGDFLIRHVLRHAVERGARIELRARHHLSDVIERDHLGLRHAVHVGEAGHQVFDVAVGQVLGELADVVGNFLVHLCLDPLEELQVACALPIGDGVVVALPLLAAEGGVGLAHVGTHDLGGERVGLECVDRLLEVAR